MKTRHLFVGILIGIAAGLILTSTLSNFVDAPQSNPGKEAPVRRLAPTNAVAEDTALLPDERNTISVFQEVAPSVVFITSKVIRQGFFFTDTYEVPAGSGSGFVWDNQGHIVTNYHVVEAANTLTVTLSDHSSYEAEKIGEEPSKDIAVLRIKAPGSKLKPVRIGSSTSLQVGQKVVAIGNPFGLDQTLTTGVVSALGREIKASNGRTIQDVIQTDAAINPGNSGGPLLDSRGQLIGINTAIISPSGSSAGIGFAVPVNTVNRIVPELIKYGRISRPGLGIQVVSDAIARRAGITGVIIGEVQRGSAAAKAGLRGLQRNRFGEAYVGDVIIGINDKPVRNFGELGDALEQYKVGDVVTVKILRDGEQRSVRVQLQEI
ncbi:MAG: trypsin-like peptidase domain-containing protein [candidate division KSB1 bacterium]|nr:trypsin-like peptidase domain-containing protein [candidate division KSB1 bacterium]MDZ7365775.1 trypsin-like peptidase domain-containing protein [candidate division KSB1 bacterium]MDZ7403746.1 trypsin-like peptidase domain-containing protein [candidate division KSB1 bacterium]